MCQIYLPPKDKDISWLNIVPRENLVNALLRKMFAQYMATLTTCPPAMHGYVGYLTLQKPAYNDRKNMTVDNLLRIFKLRAAKIDTPELMDGVVEQVLKPFCEEYNGLYSPYSPHYCLCASLDDIENGWYRQIYHIEDTTVALCMASFGLGYRETKWGTPKDLAKVGTSKFKGTSPYTPLLRKLWDLYYN